jgi:putative CocE/NonD family hydrolase
VSYHPTGDHGGAGTVTIRSSTPDRFRGVEVLHDVTATMRDGVTLVADVYLPIGGVPAPAILIRMPYGKTTPDMAMHETGPWFARKGYACVVQDVRGKHSSGGVFEPSVNEVDDGYDTVEWAIGEPWCNGTVGLWGESYYGLTSFAAAISGHPAVRAIAPGDIGTDRRRSWLRQGALLLNTTGYWALSMDARAYADVSNVDPFHLPLVDLPVTVGLEGAFYRELIASLDDAAWWDRRSLTARLGEVRCPVLSWSGWYDNYVGQQLADYERLQALHPHPETVHLMVGPWDHEGSAGLTDHAGAIPLPDTEPHRWDAYAAFFDRYLRGEENGFGDDGPVDLFTIGRNAWSPAPAWPPPSTATTLHLRAGGRLTATPPDGAEAAPDRYRYDPLDPLEETVGANCWSLCTALVDRRRHDGRDDILRYTGEPLEHDMEITGPIRARLYASSSAIDTDFTVTLCHVLADGTVNTVQDGIVRARYRDGYDRPSLIEPGAVIAYDIDLYATSYVVPAGDRIRVDISSSCFDRYDRNLNTGERTGSGVVAVVAEQAVFHSPEHPSSITLPVARR